MNSIKQWTTFFDSSALVKRYSEETGSLLVDEIFQHLTPEQITCSSLTVLEIVSVLVRKRNDGRLSQRAFRQAMIELETEMIDRNDISFLPVDDTLLFSALDLIAKHNINATDAAILRSALDLQQTLIQTEGQLMFWTSDKRLARAAQKEGLTAFDPEIESVSSLRQLLGIQDDSP